MITPIVIEIRRNGNDVVAPTAKGPGAGATPAESQRAPR
jgi:hypothetical protein